MNISGSLNGRIGIAVLTANFKLGSIRNVDSRLNGGCARRRTGHHTRRRRGRTRGHKQESECCNRGTGNPRCGHHPRVFLFDARSLSGSGIVATIRDIPATGQSGDVLRSVHSRTGNRIARAGTGAAGSGSRRIVDFSWRPSRRVPGRDVGHVLFLLMYLIALNDDRTMTRKQRVVPLSR